MLPPRYRRLWRRRLRRRPLLPFLLLATLAVDLVMLFTRTDLENSFASGLVGGQIALLGVWVTHQRRGAFARGFVAIVALLLAMQWTFGLPIEPKAETADTDFEDDFFFAFDIRPVVYSAVSVMAALVTLTAWAVRSVLARGTRAHDSRRRIRFQISSLLWATLIVVVLISFGRRGDWSILLETESLLFFLLFEVAPLLVLLSIALSTKDATSRAAWLVAAPCGAVLNAMALWPDGLFAYYSTYAAFLGAWLFFAADRGPLPEPRLSEPSIEPPPASIDLQA